MTRLRFNLLGPFEIRSREDGVVRLPAGRARVVLALLALRAGQVTARDALIEAAWNGAPPASATTRLHGLISDLRRALPAEAGAVILTRDAGYLLDAAGEEVDLLEARALMSRSRSHREQGEVAAAARIMAAALELWRGTPFGDLDCAELEAEAAAIEQAQADAVEEFAELELELGHHAALAGRLAPWTARHPLRERLVGGLIRALAGSGRQAEAIAAYHQLRRRLADELGVDPAPPLQELYRSILNGDRGLLTPRPAGQSRASLQDRYDRLEPELARVFALLGIVGSPLLCAGQAAALCEVSVDRARRFLDGLTDVRLLESPAVGVYRMHDLVWLFASDVADASVPRRESDRAIGRLVDWYKGVALLRAP